MDSRQPYQVIARRFRPKTFDEVVGQDVVVQSLRSSLSSERIPHAFLFSGSRGVGKTTLARILARALNCAEGPGPAPCGVCAPCTDILAGTNADVVEIDAASHNLVDDIRELRERVGFASMGSRFKVYILDEVHMLTRSAFNAFLKTLEEPPPSVVFILATTELHKVPETIRSRCQVLLFGRVGDAEIARRLATICRHEGVAVASEVLAEIATSSRGGMRDAETALERVLPLARELGDTFQLETWRSMERRVGIERVVELVDRLVAGEAAPALHFADAVVQGGIDQRQALGEVLDVLRAVLLLVVDGPDSALVQHGGEVRERLVGLASRADAARLDAMIHAGLLGRERIRRLEDRRLVLEVTLLRMASAGQLPLLGELVEAFATGAAAAPARPAAAAPDRPPGAPAAPVDLSARLIARLGEVKPMLVSTLEECEIEGPDDAGGIVLSLRSDRKIHRDRLQSPPVRQMLRDMLTELLGRPATVRVRSPAPEEAAAQETPPAPSPGAEPGAVVRKVIEKFDGQALERDDS